MTSKRKRYHQKKRRASFKVRGEVGFFDRGDRDIKLSQLGDSKTLWAFKERVREIELTDVSFARFDGELSAQGLSAKDGQSVDAVKWRFPRQ
jgi:hypothetical protein